MDFNRLCKGCFHEKPEANKTCPYCGFDESEYERNRKPEILPLNTVLRGAYLLGKCLGKGGFGITYIGWHINLQTIVAIKEFFPSGVVFRDTDNTISKNSASVLLTDSGLEQTYQKSLGGFIKEARTLGKLHLPGVVRVSDCFEENQTAYIVMDYVDGLSLSRSMKQSGSVYSEKTTLEMIHPVIKSLENIHKTGIIHRDISPENLIVGQDKSITLVDFGAARVMSAGTTGEYAAKSLTVVLKPGYAPIEQYNSHGSQGPWTDVYALCATMYKMMTRITLEDPTTRTDRDDDEQKIRKPLEENGVSVHTSDVLVKGLQIRGKDRYQSMEDLEEALYSDVDVKRRQPEKQSYTSQQNVSEKNIGITQVPSGPSGNNKGKWIAIISAAALLIMGAVIGLVYISKQNARKERELIAQKESQEASERQSEIESQEASERASEAEAQKASERASEAESQKASERASEAESQAASEKVAEAAAVKVEVGDIIGFGSYEQDNDASNGKEAIEWQVLDVEGEKAFVISKYGLEARTYSEEWTEVTWETCDLRNWLNSTFYEEAFSENERKKILETAVKAEDNDVYGTKAGNDTADKIFLLSISEAEDLFEDNEARKCYTTEYVKGQGAYTYDETGTCWWWLRSPGVKSNYAASVTYGGAVGYYGYFVDNDYVCVRPALWIDLKS